MRNLSQIISWVRFHHKNPYKRNTGEVRVGREGIVMTEAETELMCFEDVGRTTGIDGHEKLRKARKWILFSKSPERISPINTLTLALQN